MQFRKHSAGDAASGVWALFRDAPGLLRSGDLAADAAVFAGRGSEDWIAIGARTVERGGMPLFTTSAPVNAAWNRSQTGVSLEVDLSSPTSVEVQVNWAVTSISVDGLPVRHNEQGTRLRLPTLRKGEHHVWIATRAAL
jgi:hypothetical protein